MAEQNITLDGFLSAWNGGQQIWEIQSSGSTGEPKLIELTREQLLASALITGKFLKVQKSDQIHCCLPLNKISGFMQLVRSVVWGVPVAYKTPSLNPLENQAHGTIISLTPLQLSAVLKSENSRQFLNQYRIVLIGGGALNKTLEKKLLGLNPTFYHTYGMTETCSHVALRKCNAEDIFYPLPEISVAINDEGCLKIKGEVTGGQWIETHDLAEITGAGFVITGRSDFVINSGGQKIQPEQVEHYLNELLNLPENSILISGMPDAELGQKVTLFVNKKNYKEIISPDLNYPENFWKPKQIIYLENFEFTENGKINRLATIRASQS